MEDIRRLPDGELAIMQIVWGSAPPVPRWAVEEALGERRLAPRTILTFLTRLCGKGFLSLEPHLTDFAGLAALEQDPQKRGSALDGKSAWKLALDSLKEILAGIPQAKEAR